MSKTRHKWQKCTWLVATLTVVVLYLTHFTLQVQKNPLILDEVDYYQCMENIVRLGLPLYYAGEVNIDQNHLIRLSTRYINGQEFVFWRFKPETGIRKEAFFALVNRTSRYTFGMWHPPLYIYLGSLVFLLLPLTPESSHLLRYFNLVFSIGVFAGMFILSRELYPTRYPKVFLLALLLYALNSLAVRGSILVDYNATLGPCAAVWLVIASLRAERKKRLSWELALSVVWVLFTGLGIAMSLFVGLGAYSLLRFTAGQRRYSARVTLSVASGIAIFVILFWGLCQALRIPFSQPFLHNIARGQAIPSNPLSLQRLSILWKHLWWYGEEIGVLTVVAWFSLDTLANIRRAQQAHGHLLIALTIAAGLFFHAFIAANAYWFPKYILFTLPLLFLSIAGKGTVLASGSSWQRPVFTAIFILLILTNGLNSLHWLLQPGSTLYSPGEQGMLQIAHKLQAVTSPDDIVLCRKDIGFFSHRKFIEWSGRLLSDANFLQTRVSEANVHYAVSHINWLDPTTDVGKFLGEHFSVVDRIEDFILLRRKSE